MSIAIIGTEPVQKVGNYLRDFFCVRRAQNFSATFRSHQFLKLIFVFIGAASTVVLQLPYFAMASSLDDNIKSTEKAFAAKGTVRSRGDVLTFDLANQPCGATIPVTLTVENESDFSLELKLLPTCSCTKLEPSKLALVKGGTIEIKTTIELPKVPKQLSIAIACQDENTGFNFVVAVTCNAVARVATKPNEIRVSSKESKTLEIEFESLFKGTLISSVRLLDSSVSGTISINPDSKNAHAKIDFSPSLLPTSEVRYDLIFEVSTVHGSKIEETDIVSVPIHFFDRIRINPSVVTLRTKGDQLQAMMFLSGPETTPDLRDLVVEAWVQDTVKQSLVFRVDSVTKRKERAYILVASIGKEEFSTWLEGSNPKTLLTVSSQSNLVGDEPWKSQVLLANFIWTEN